MSLPVDPLNVEADNTRRRRARVALRLFMGAWAAWIVYLFVIVPFQESRAGDVSIHEAYAERLHDWTRVVASKSPFPALKLLSAPVVVPLIVLGAGRLVFMLGRSAISTALFWALLLLPVASLAAPFARLWPEEDDVRFLMSLGSAIFRYVAVIPFVVLVALGAVLAGPVGSVQRRLIALATLVYVVVCLLGLRRLAESDLLGIPDPNTIAWGLLEGVVSYVVVATILAGAVKLYSRLQPAGS